MANSFNKFDQFLEDVFKVVHNFTDDSTCTLKVALLDAAHQPVRTNSILANLTEIAYTFCSSRIITGVTCEQTLGIVHLTGNNLILTSSGGDTGPFRYVVLYNDDPTSPAKPLIGWYDYGDETSIFNGESFTIVIQTDFGTVQ